MRSGGFGPALAIAMASFATPAVLFPGCDESAVPWMPETEATDSGAVDDAQADAGSDPAVHPARVEPLLGDGFVGGTTGVGGDDAGEVRVVENCVNGLDDDGDGKVDIADPDCATYPYPDEYCDDGIDNDGDGLVDCDDSWCAGRASCN